MLTNSEALTAAQRRHCADARRIAPGGVLNEDDNYLRVDDEKLPAEAGSCDHAWVAHLLDWSQ